LLGICLLDRRERERCNHHYDRKRKPEHSPHIISWPAALFSIESGPTDYEILFVETGV
jgi:hypothetical protein